MNTAEVRPGCSVLSVTAGWLRGDSWAPPLVYLLCDMNAAWNNAGPGMDSTPQHGHEIGCPSFYRHLRAPCSRVPQAWNGACCPNRPTSCLSRSSATWDANQELAHAMVGHWTPAKCAWGGRVAAIAVQAAKRIPCIPHAHDTLRWRIKSAPNGSKAPA